MRSAVRLFLSVALLSALSACGGARPEPVVPRPQTTSAAISGSGQDHGQARCGEQGDEEPAAQRDDQREALHRLFEEQRATADVRRDRDELAVRVVEAIENADLTIDGLHEESVKDQWRKWPRVHKESRAAQRYKAKLLVDLRRLHGDLGMMTWPAFKADVERTIAELEEATDRARAIY